MEQTRSRRERPAKPALSRDVVVEAALQVLLAEGIEKLTMRRLAAELDTGAASLYVYVRNTNDLHALLLDRLLADLDLTWSGRGDWRRRLRTLLASYVALLVQHPGLARSAIAVWPDGPHYLDLVELVLRLLTHGGVPASRAGWGVDILLQLATAMAAEYATRGESGAQDDADIAGALGTADERRHPILHDLGPEQMMGGEGGARRDWALEAMISGIADTPRPDEDEDED